jgi:hypothetical protein
MPHRIMNVSVYSVQAIVRPALLATESSPRHSTAAAPCALSCSSLAERGLCNDAISLGMATDEL